MVTRLFRIIYLAGACLFLAGALCQFFLAGLGVFAGPSNWGKHREFGLLLGMLALLLIMLALIARLPGRMIGMTAGLFGLFIVQVLLLVPFQFHISYNALHIIKALHPVNGIALVLVALTLAKRAWAFIQMPRVNETLSEKFVESSTD